MDSGNSGGSMQSSSGGDEEYNSRAGLFSNQAGHFASISNPKPPPIDHHHNPSSPTFLSPPFHNFSSFSQSPTTPTPNPNPNPNTPYNLDSIWSRGLRSDPNYTHHLVNLTSYSESSLVSSSSQEVLSDRNGPNQSRLGPFRSTKSLPEHPNIAKNPKKRARASRKAPTTVLTTDTTNFRQMVQDFTGVPGAPFSTSPYSRGLDLFGTGSTRSGPFESLYPLRPSVLKPHPLPFMSASSSSSTSSPSFLNSTINTFNSGNYQLPPNLGLVSKQGPNFPNMGNPVTTFNYPLTNSQGSSRIHSLGELGMSHEHVNPSFTSTGFQGNDQGQLGSFNGDSEHVVTSSGYRLNCSASTSDFRTEKGSENVSSRGDEGTMDSWVCPSD